ncbi:FUSC family protein [Bradyrhizobium erythrophlei]|uniref:FUSC family protein n=1 Tax=Bradyrhizobium erythrophlei TaxID=1437360 RepID=UPI0035EBAF81
MIATAAQREPFSVVGISVSSWTFAIRVWLATILALFASFWLQLEAPTSAAVTVAILAEPTRGQALDKAGFRLMATILGVIASIAITGLFSQSRDLMLTACSVWLGLCVFAAKLLDGHRAYAAVLSGYTVAIVAIQQIDNPQNVFDAGVERGAAIAVGIMSIAVVNALMSAPDRHPRLAAQLAAIHRRVRQYASASFHGETSNPATFPALVREIVELRPEIGSVALESSSGPVRSAAARSAVVRLVAELQAARTLNTAPIHLDVATRDQTNAKVDPIDSSRSKTRMPVGLVSGQRRAPGVPTETSAWKIREFLRQDESVRQDLLALRSIKWPSRLWRAPIYRSYRTAAETGLRAALWFAIASTFFVWAGWSAASASLSSFTQFAALAIITPNPRGFTAIALIGIPIAAVSAGILEFIVLNGADGFSVLAIALAPFTICAALLTASQNPLWSGLGRINLVGIATILAPSNPQSYNPQTFLFTSLFLFTAAAVLLAAQMLIPPVSDDKQRMRLLTEARGELGRPDLTNGEAPEEAMFRDASRIGQFLSAGGAQDSRALAEMLSCFDQSAMVRLCDSKLIQLSDGPFVPLAAQARAAIVTRDTATLRTVASVLREKAPHRDSIEAETAACLVLTSDAFDQDSGLESSREAT